MERLSALFVALFVFSLSAEARHIKGEYLVRIKSNVNIQSVQLKDIRVLKEYNLLSNLYLLKSENPKVFEKELKENPSVLYFEKNYLRKTADWKTPKRDYRVLADPEVPSPIEFPQEWIKDPKEAGNYGTHQNYTHHVWREKKYYGSKDTVIAVIDTGVDYTHPDLLANIWRNPGEVADNGIDDDGNGYVDDVVGYDFVNGDSRPYDDHSHGTHVAGIAAATGGNGIGISGQCPRCSIMALKFISSDGWGSDADAITALEYATRNGAHIINSSWGSDEYSKVLHDAFEASNNAGVLNTVAAGNSGYNIEIEHAYPARFVLSGGLTVSALREANNSILMPLWSNYSKKYSHISSAGEDVRSTVPGNDYIRISGTSMAAPGVAGCAGMIRSHSPNLSAQEIKSILMDSDHTLYDPRSMRKVMSGGRVHMVKVFKTLDGQ